MRFSRASGCVTQWRKDLDCVESDSPSDIFRVINGSSQLDEDSIEMKSLVMRGEGESDRMMASRSAIF
jgi:hypothetical protein